MVFGCVPGSGGFEEQGAAREAGHASGMLGRRLEKGGGCGVASGACSEA